MIRVLDGNDRFRLRQARIAYLSEFRDDRAVVTKTFEVEDNASLGEALAFLRGGTLFHEAKAADMRVISWNAELTKHIMPELELLNTTERLLLVEWQAPTPPPKILAEYRETFPRLEGTKLSSWIRDTAKNLGNDITKDAISRLVELWGSDTEGLWHDILTLSCWKPDATIDAADVEEFHRELPQPESFAIVDALLEGNRKRAFTTLEYAIAKGEEPIRILGSIATLLRSLLVATAAKTTSGRSGDAAVRAFFRDRHPYWVSRVMYGATRTSYETVRKQFQKLLGSDIALKTGRTDARTTIEALILGV